MKKPKDEGPDALYRVFRTEDGRPVYLAAPGDKGLELDDATRLSNLLAIPTEVRKVWERGSDDE